MAVAAAVLAACASVDHLPSAQPSGLLQRGACPGRRGPGPRQGELPLPRWLLLLPLFPCPQPGHCGDLPVPPDIWYYLSKGDRGTCAIRRRFISFTRDGELIAVDRWRSGISCGGYTARNTKILLLFPCILGIIGLSSSGTSRPENHGLPIAKEAASYEVLHL